MATISGITANAAIPRPSNRTARVRSGVTLVELFIALTIIAILAGLLIVIVGRVRSSASVVSCLSNLRTLGEGFRLYAVDHGGRLPDPVEANTSWEEMIARYIGEPEAFKCPADKEVFPSVGSSY